MTRVRALGAYLIWVFAGATLLAPWVWWLAKGASSAWPEAELGWLVDHPFSRYVHRCLLVLAVAGLWPLTRAMGCRTWEAAGWRASAGGMRRMGWGFVAGILGFSLLVGVEGWMGARDWKEGISWGKVAGGAGSAILAAGVVATIEETLFRGVLFGGMQSAIGGRGAILVSSGFYSLVHFFGRPGSPAEVTWLSGVETLLGMMGGLVEWSRLVPAFVTLFLLGLLLGLSRYRDGSVHFSVGLHAGLVFWVKMRGVLTQTPPGQARGGDLLQGWLPLVMTWVGLMFYLYQTEPGRGLGRGKSDHSR